MVKLTRMVRAAAMLTAALLATLTLPANGQACDPTKACCANPGGGNPGCGGGASPASPGGVSPLNVGAGNPINIITGNKYQREEDLAALPGVLGLEIVRHYNSAASGLDSKVGTFGRGWRLSYDTELVVKDAQTLEVSLADGSAVAFSKIDAAWLSLQPGQGRITSRKTARGVEYTWRWGAAAGAAGAGRELLFDAQGKLIQISAPTGEFVTLQRDPQGWLVQVTDPQGRTLHLNYLDKAVAQGDRNANQRFRGVRSIDSPVGRYTYGYNDQGALTPEAVKAQLQARRIDAVELLANLVQVSLPTHYDADQKAHAFANRGVSSSSVNRLYHYEDPAHPTLLTGITVSGQGSDGQQMLQRISTYAYDAYGRANLSVRGEPARLELAADGRPVEPRRLAAGTGAEQVTLQWPRAGEVVLTNALGQETRYSTARIAGQDRLLQASGAGCVSCAPVNLRYAYDARGQLLEVTRITLDGTPLEGQRTELDAQGRAVNVSRVAYVDGKPQPAQWMTRYEYAADSDLPGPALIARPSVIPGKEHTLRFAYNQAGQTTEVSEEGFSPLDERGLPSAAAASLKRTTAYAYARINGRSMLTKIDGPLPNGPKGDPADSDVTLFRYDAQGNFAIDAIAPGALLTRYIDRDVAGRPRQVAMPDGVTLTHDYEPLGQISRLMRAGTSTSMRYDARGWLASISEDTGQRMSFKYGADGRVAAIFDAQNNRIELQRDTEGALQNRRLLNPDGTLAQQTDPARLVVDSEHPGRQGEAGFRVGNYTRDELAYPGGNSGQVFRAADGLPQAIVEPGNQAIQFSYDAQRRLTELADARGIKTGYVYDDFGRLIAVLSPEAGKTVLSYDNADQLTTKTTGAEMAGAVTSTYRYDAAGRVIALETPDGPTRIAYGSHGRPTLIEYPGGAERFEYDSAVRLTSHTRSIDGEQFTTRYAYDEFGRRSSKTLPDGQRLEYGYNGPQHARAGLLARITRRDVFGETLLLDGINSASDRYASARHQLANGVVWERELDANGNITRIGSKGHWQEGLAFDSSRQLLARASTSEAQRPTAFSGYAYDNLARMTGSYGAVGSAGYHYDAAGNTLARVIRAQSVDVTTFRVDAGNNRIVGSSRPDAKGGETWSDYAYNAQGSITQAGQRQYHWDSQQRLARVSEKDAFGADRAVASYVYNAFGERIKKTTYSPDGARAARVTYYFYDGGELSAEVDQTDRERTTRQYVWMDDRGASRPIAVLQSRADDLRSTLGRALQALPAEAARAGGAATRADVYAVVSDHTGAARAMVDESGSVVWRAEAAGYGRMQVQSASLQLNLRGSNQYFDTETGLHYNTRRYLDTDSGRYLSADPTGQEGGLNVYAFAANNPLANIDPQGLQAQGADVSAWSFQQRLKYVIEKAIPQVPGEIGNVLRDMITPTNLAITAGVFAVWAVAQLTPAGWIADIAIAGLGYFFLGEAILKLMKLTVDTYNQTTSAKCTRDLDAAANNFAKIVSEVAVNLGAYGATKVAGILGKFFKGRPSGYWSLNPFQRGVAIEKALGHNVPPSYPVIDRWNPATGLGTSIKSLDLNAATYQSISSLRSTLKGYIDTLSRFNGVARPSLDTLGKIKTRSLELVIPNPGNAAQRAELQAMIRYAASIGVDLKIIVLP